MQVLGAVVDVYRIRDPVNGDDSGKFDPAVLAAPVATPALLLKYDCIIIGAPGRQVWLLSAIVGPGFSCRASKVKCQQVSQAA
jgi:hypothetical protein